MRIWAIANQKGGVGKTTSSLCLARCLADLGHRVLLVDLDPHGSLSRAFGIAAEPPPKGTFDLFNGESIASVARATGQADIQLVAAQAAMATLERRSATQPGLGLALHRALMGADDDYDFALLDCPPTLSLLLVNALAACDRLVVPTQTDPLALHGLEGMLRTAAMVERSRGRALVRQILPTLYDRRTRTSHETLEHLNTYPGVSVCPWPIPMDTRLRDAASLATQPRHLAGRGINAYRDALQWLLETADARPQEAAA